jgi:hypothetical protein
MKPWRFSRPVVADSHHSPEEQEPDPHYREKLEPDPHLTDADPQPWFNNDNSALLRVFGYMNLPFVPQAVRTPSFLFQQT